MGYYLSLLNDRVPALLISSRSREPGAIVFQVSGIRRFLEFWNRKKALKKAAEIKPMEIRDPSEKISRANYNPCLNTELIFYGHLT